ncbi:MAG TPA: cobalamin biosynthesis protein CobW [Alphaproteobacteria bacterium]|nr:cobalamin biosynthesis protein CobW [Alphaproteobacteria bacterium]
MIFRSRIPATVLTGFLGAGKTTTLRHLLASAHGRRLALVINEFGELGVDRELLLGCGIADCREEDVIELANGCICCTVADDFLPTIEKLIDRDDPPDHIVIETSGLALPKPLVKAFAWPEVRSRVTVDGVIALIDAPALAAGRFADDPTAIAAQRAGDPALGHDNPLAELFDDQLACADLVLLNKTDLLAPEAVDTLAAALRLRLRPGVKLLRARFGQVDASVLLGVGAAAEDDLASRPSSHEADGAAHDHDDFESFALPLGPIVAPDALMSRLAEIIARHDILRIKGFLDVPGKAMRLALQGVGPRIERYFDRPWSAGERRVSTLVVIGRKGIDQHAIAAALAGQPAA